MRVISILFVILFAMSCQKVDTRILGEWQVQSPYYQADYYLFGKGATIMAKVLHYDDGTTKFRHQQLRDAPFLFKQLVKKEDVFVDAMSGATQSNLKTLSIRQRHMDTLEVAFYINGKAAKEIWIRKDGPSQETSLQTLNSYDNETNIDL
jgi:hypothetical protein